MKKCPECGNPSYDGAPVCGNCGYTFPKPKTVAPKREDIFQQPPSLKKAPDNKSTLTILKEKKLIIGAILIITVIVILGIFLTGSNNNTTSPIQTNDFITYTSGDFSFKYPKNWEEVNLNDSEHNGAKFLKNNNTIIEYYNVTSDSSSLKEINQNRITSAQESGDFLELLETITLDGRNSSNMIFENADGDYTRYVSMFSDGELYVFKVTGDSFNSVSSGDVDSVINTADIK